MKYSAASLFANALSGHKNWPEQFPNKEPKKDYDVIIVGGGGHGLGAAYYLAKKHGITNVAVLEKSWIGAGIQDGTRQLSVPIISLMKAQEFTIMRSICGMVCLKN